MNRYARKILRGLELRVGRLEKQSTKGDWVDQCPQCHQWTLLINDEKGEEYCTNCNYYNKTPHLKKQAKSSDVYEGEDFPVQLRRVSRSGEKEIEGLIPRIILWEDSFEDVKVRMRKATLTRLSNNNLVEVSATLDIANVYLADFEASSFNSSQDLFSFVETLIPSNVQDFIPPKHSSTGVRTVSLRRMYNLQDVGSAELTQTNSDVYTLSIPIVFTTEEIITERR